MEKTMHHLTAAIRQAWHLAGTHIDKAGEFFPLIIVIICVFVAFLITFAIAWKFIAVNRGFEGWKYPPENKR